MALAQNAPLPLRLAQWLAVVVTVLLFAQWPLREFVGGGSLLANDLAQAVFALYVSIAVAHASARGAHLTAHPEALARSRWRRIGAAAAPLPWCVWLLATGAAPAARSLMQAEQFPETFNPGYFAIKAAPVLLAGLLLVHCVRALRLAWLRH